MAPKTASYPVSGFLIQSGFSRAGHRSCEKVDASLKTPHTHFKRGTSLRIIFRDGRKICDEYEDRGSGLIVLRSHGKLQLKSVKAVTIWKGRSTL